MIYLMLLKNILFYTYNIRIKYILSAILKQLLIFFNKYFLRDFYPNTFFFFFYCTYKLKKEKKIADYSLTCMIKILYTCNINVEDKT